MNNKITTLLNKPDNIELIRDQLCAILKVECTAQHELAINEPDAKDYKIGVWKEKSRPWQLTADSEKEYPFPLVNIQLMGFNIDTPPGPSIEQKKYTGKFYLDCYARGEFGDAEADDTDSAIKACKVGRVIRNILSSEHYPYLGLRGIVRDWRVTECTIGDPRNNEQSAQSVTICRLVFSVEYYEDSPQITPNTFQEYNFIYSSPSGEILFDIAGSRSVRARGLKHLMALIFFPLAGVALRASAWIETRCGESRIPKVICRAPCERVD